MTDKLTPFEDEDVVSAKIEIPDAAGGLREALTIDPVELHRGDEVYIALRCRVKKIRFDPVDKATAKRSGDSLTRVHVLETIEAAFLEEDQVAEHIRENVDRVKREVERLAGVQRLDDALDPDVQAMMDDDDAQEMVKAHRIGLHPNTTVAGCPSCAEREADRAEDQRQRADLD